MSNIYIVSEIFFFFNRAKLLLEKNNILKDKINIIRNLKDFNNINILVNDILIIDTDVSFLNKIENKIINNNNIVFIGFDQKEKEVLDKKWSNYIFFIKPINNNLINDIILNYKDILNNKSTNNNKNLKETKNIEDINQNAVNKSVSIKNKTIKNIDNLKTSHIIQNKSKSKSKNINRDKIKAYNRIKNREELLRSMGLNDELRKIQEQIEKEYSKEKHQKENKETTNENTVKDNIDLSVLEDDELKALDMFFNNKESNNLQTIINEPKKQEGNKAIKNNKPEASTNKPKKEEGINTNNKLEITINEPKKQEGNKVIKNDKPKVTINKPKQEGVNTNNELGITINEPKKQEGNKAIKNDKPEVTINKPKQEGINTNNELEITINESKKQEGNKVIKDNKSEVTINKPKQKGVNTNNELEITINEPKKQEGNKVIKNDTAEVTINNSKVNKNKKDNKIEVITNKSKKQNKTNNNYKNEFIKDKYKDEINNMIKYINNNDNLDDLLKLKIPKKYGINNIKKIVDILEDKIEYLNKIEEERAKEEELKQRKEEEEKKRKEEEKIRKIEERELREKIYVDNVVERINKMDTIEDVESFIEYKDIKLLKHNINKIEQSKTNRILYLEDIIDREKKRIEEEKRNIAKKRLEMEEKLKRIKEQEEFVKKKKESEQKQYKDEQLIYTKDHKRVNSENIIANELNKNSNINIDDEDLLSKINKNQEENYEFYKKKQDILNENPKIHENDLIGVKGFRKKQQALQDVELINNEIDDNIPINKNQEYFDWIKSKELLNNKKEFSTHDDYIEYSKKIMDHNRENNNESIFDKDNLSENNNTINGIKAPRIIKKSNDINDKKFVKNNKKEFNNFNWNKTINKKKTKSEDINKKLLKEKEVIKKEKEKLEQKEKELLLYKQKQLQREIKEKEEKIKSMIEMKKAKEKEQKIKELEESNKRKVSETIKKGESSIVKNNDNKKHTGQLDEVNNIFKNDTLSEKEKLLLEKEYLIQLEKERLAKERANIEKMKADLLKKKQEKENNKLLDMQARKPKIKKEDEGSINIPRRKLIESIYRDEAEENMYEEDNNTTKNKGLLNIFNKFKKK